MKRLNTIARSLRRTVAPSLLRGLGGACLCALLLACSTHDDDPRASMTHPLTFYVQAAGEQTAVSRAHEGDVGASNAESAINNVKVWLFDSEVEGLLLDYQETSGDKVVMQVPQYIVEQQRPVDIYAIGNADVVGLSGLDGTATLSDLKTQTLQGTNFTPTGIVRLGGTGGVNGLPYSRVLQRQPVVVTKDGKKTLGESLGTISMTRAVSKIRFAFARTTGIDDVAITGIELDGDLIPESEYIFPVDSLTDAASYTDDGHYIGDLVPHLASGTAYDGNKLVIRADGDTDFTTTLIATDDIRDYDNPSDNTWANMKAANSSLTAQGYDEHVSTIIQLKYDHTVYLRETGKTLSGTIHYTVSGKPKSAPFAMTDDQANDFARNHSWIVYGYFEGDELVLTVNVMPWTKWLRTTDYKDNVSVSQALAWNTDTYDDKSSAAANDETTGSAEEIAARKALRTIDGVEHQMIVLQYGISLEGTFSFDTPYGGTWMAILEPVNGAENGSIVFSNDQTTISGTIGTSAVTLQVKAAQNQVTQNQYARLRFVCYSADNQPYSVKSEIIGGDWMIAQYAN